MTPFSPVSLTALELKNDDLAQLALVSNRPDNLTSFHPRCSQMSRFPIPYQKYAIEIHLFTDLTL